ncbi:MAG: hypothetical protein ACRD03_06015 [Acidimicrobiales bacterium]
MATTALVSCRASPTEKAPLPEAAPVVAVTLEEYRFGFDRSIPAGRVIFRFRNAGREVHRPALFALPDDLPPLDEQLRGSTRRPIAPFAGMSNRAPGATGTFAVDLVPGRRYGFVCFARGADDRSPHSLEGMSFEFRAGGAAETMESEPPSSPTTVEAQQRPSDVDGE